ncbi:MAG: hypothetical protein ACPGN3_10245 [Opitutales bacterium]
MMFSMLRLRKSVRILCSAFVLLWITCTIAWSVEVPYENDFELSDGVSTGSQSELSDWVFSGSLSTAVSGDAASGAQSLTLSGSGLATLELSSAVPPLVGWYDFYVKPVVVAEEELPESIAPYQASVTGFVDLSGQGWIFVIDGDGLGSGQWVQVGNSISLNGRVADSWMRLTYRLDYIGKIWDLYVDGEFVATDLGFLDAGVDGFNHFKLGSDADDPTGLDFFYSGESNPLFADTANDGLPDSWLSLQGLDTSINQRNFDYDFDGLTNLEEYQLSTLGTNADTDDDGISDSAEIAISSDPTLADPFVFNELPLFEGFESWASGSVTTTGAWTVVGNAVSVEIGSAYAGDNHLSVGGPSEVFSFLKGSGNSVIWLDHWLIPSPATVDAVIDADVSAAYAFDELGRLRVYDPSQPEGLRWQTADTLAASGWMRITLKSDYANQWTDFYVNGARVFSEIPFIQTKPFLTQMEIYGETDLDDLSVSSTQPFGLDDDRDGLTNEEESPLGTNPLIFDTDNDGIGDFTEVQWGLDPLNADVSAVQLAPEGEGVYSWSTEFSLAEGYVEGPLNGQLGWTSAGVVEIQNDETLGVDDVGPITSEAKRLFGVGDMRRIWISFDADLIEGELPAAVSTNHAFAIGKKQESSVSIWDSATDQWLDFSPDSLAAGVNTYAFYLDYLEKTASAFVNGVLIAQELPFINLDLVHFSHLEILQEVGSSSSATFDNLTVSTAEPANMDFDGDGLLNEQERLVGSDIYNDDSDSDGMNDLWEFSNGLDLLVDDGALDADGDGLLNFDEFETGTDPLLADSDSDGFSDLEEFRAKTNPLDTDEAPDGYLPSPWLIADYRSVDPGFGFVFGDSWRLTSAGDGVEDSSFFYRELSGGYSMTFLVTDLDTEKDNVQLGLMVRDDVGANSKMLAGYYRVKEKFYQADRTSGGANLSKNGPTHYGDYLPGLYLRISRGEVFTVVETSDDGILWSVIAESATQFAFDTVAGFYLSSADGDKIYVSADVQLLDYFQDTDFDGLSDTDESTIYLTNPLLADTDGDGVSDGEEILVRGSDPLVSEYTSTSTILAINGREATPVAGDWVTSGDSIYSSSLNGELAFDFNVSVPGIYEIHYKVGRRLETSLTLGMPVFFVAKIDGHYLDNVQIAEGEFSQDQVLLTPYLNEGNHTINLRWDNVFRGRSILVDYVRVESPDFASSALRDDWELAVLNAQEGAFEHNIVTHVSHVSLEGYSRFPGMMTISNGATLKRSEESQWYARVALSEPNTTFALNYQNGGLAQNIDVSWEPIVLFADDGPEEMTLTVGSQLKFRVSDLLGSSGQVTIDTSVYSGLSESDEIIHTFSEAGRFSLTADITYSGGETDSRLISVDVVDIPDVSRTPNVWLEQQRNWSWENISSPISVSAGQALAEVTSSGENYMSFEIGASNEFPGNTLTARLPDGSPIASVDMNSLWVVEAVEGYLNQYDLGDGTHSVTSTLYISPDFPADAVVRVDIFKAGVTFADGTRVREIALSDFSDEGTYDFVLIKPDSVRGSACHRTYVYQDGVLVGKIGRR